MFHKFIFTYLFLNFLFSKNFILQIRVFFLRSLQIFVYRFIQNELSFSRVLIRKSDNARKELSNERRLSDSGSNEDQPLQLHEISSSEPERLPKRKEQQETSSCDKRKHTNSSFVSSSSYNFRLKQKLRLINFGIIFVLYLDYTK